MNDKLNLFFEYLTVELGLASNTRLAYERDLRLFKEALGLKDNDALATVSVSYTHLTLPTTPYV